MSEVVYRFSGHESFPCRYAWIPKAVEAISGNPEVFGDIEAKVRDGGTVSEEDFARARQMGTWAHEKCGEITGFAFRWAGTTPVRNPNVLGRCMRDTLVANSHLLFDSKTMTDAGGPILKSWIR